MAETAGSSAATSRFLHRCPSRSSNANIQLLAKRSFSLASGSKHSMPRWTNHSMMLRSSGSLTTALFMEVGGEEGKRPQIFCSVGDYSNGIHVSPAADMYETSTRRRRCTSNVRCGLTEVSSVDHTTSSTRAVSDATTAVVTRSEEETAGGGNGAPGVASSLSLDAMDAGSVQPGLISRGIAQEDERENAAAATTVISRSKARKTLLLASVALVMSLCNADRVVMSVAVMPLAATHSWSSSFLGIIQSSFLWGYVISSAVGGGLADRYGGKRVMAGGVALWSLATLLTPWAAGQSTAVLLAVRALFGLAEGVAIPAMNVILSRWFPSNERASAVGLSMAGFHMGNVMGFLLSPVLLAQLGVQGPFLLFAAVGFLWLYLCLPVIPNENRHPTTTPTNHVLNRHFSTSTKVSLKIKTAPSISIRRLLSKMPSWAIIFANVTNNWGYFVLLSWMPVYFKTVFDVKLKEAAWFSAIPWALMAISSYIVGMSSDYLIKSGYPLILVRKIMQSIGFIGPGIALICLNYTKTPSIAVALLTVALSLSSFSQAGFLLNMQDIAPNSAGLLHGIANSFGTMAAIISTIGTGYFVQWLGSFQAFLTLTSLLYFTTTIFWCIHATADQVFF